MQDLVIQVGSSLSSGVEEKILRFIQLTPRIMGALAVFLFGWILAELASRFIIRVGDTLKLEFISEKLGLKHFLERMKSRHSPSVVIAKSVKGYLIFLFFIEATKIAEFTKVADFLSLVIGYIPDLIIAIFIMLVGIRIGNTMQLIISTSLGFAKSKTANILGIAAKGMIITFAILAALTQLDIAEVLVQTLFIGFVAMLTLAGGLAFGLGGKDVVKELLEAIKKVEVKKAYKK